MMRDEKDRTLREVEETQEALKRNIEESGRLIERSQELLERYRGEAGQQAAA